MTKARRNHHRENRIREEIIVDAYGPEEQAVGWYYYLEDKIHFPFHAQCIFSVPTLECPVFFEPVLVRETVGKGAEHGEGQEAYT
jgi:hypothetical protein